MSDDELQLREMTYTEDMAARPAEPQGIQVLCSLLAGSRLHEFINNPDDVDFDAS